MGQKVSLVLSGGGARGIAHIGVIEELESRGAEINSIVGTSMGAVVGAVYAMGKMEEFKNWMFTLDRIKVLSLLDITLSKQGLIKGDKIFQVMKELFSDGNIEDLHVPFSAVAADLLNNKEVLFTKGNIYEAIRASVAIPTVITPVKKGKTYLVDGGVLNNLPLKYARRTKGDILVAVNVNAHIPADNSHLTKKEKAERQSVYMQRIRELQEYLHLAEPAGREEKIGYFELINKTIALLTNKVVQMSIEQYKPDVLIEVSHDSCRTYDFYKAEEMVGVGHYAASRALGAGPLKSLFLKSPLKV